jgi:hypothetical protein
MAMYFLSNAFYSNISTVVLPKMCISFNTVTGNTLVSIVTGHGAGWTGEMTSWQEK